MIEQYDIYISKEHKDGSLDITIRDNYKLHEMLKHPKMGDEVSDYTTTVYRANITREGLKEKYANANLYDLTK